MRDPNYQNTQTIQTPQYSQQQRKSGLNTGYISTIPGLIHLLLIIFLFCCWVSIAAVPKTAYLGIPRLAVENAFLFFSITAFLIEIILLIIELFEINKLNALSSLPWFLIVTIKDIFYAIPLFALSIAAAVFEGYQRNGTYTGCSASSVYTCFNQGAYASASFFGFLVFFLYVGHAVISIRQHFSSIGN